MDALVTIVKMMSHLCLQLAIITVRFAAGLLIGILSALGIAQAERLKSREKQRIQERQGTITHRPGRDDEYL